ncbi:MAG: SGNH/GDSL hydrolase family protein [Cyclobacteriaceae bacterium]|nr:SGNH/GDSL hydrolase family protein [Cyclobacteriaceae bacterium]
MRVFSWTMMIMFIVASSFTFLQKKRVVFFGDSITQAGASSGGYILKIGDLAVADGKASQFEFMGAGIGGNKIYDLFLRMEDDVLVKNPDVVVIYIGVNDVWHKRSFGTGTDPDKFEKFYTAIINKLKAKNIAVILCTPGVIGERTDFSNELDGDLNRYSTIIRSLATKNGLQLIDLRKAFLEYNIKSNPENKESGILTTDRVHLNEKGNQLVAEQMWKVIKSL